MKVGDLVKITRASVGIPKETIGLIFKENDGMNGGGYKLWDVQLVNSQRMRRYLCRDLEIISESR